MDIVIPIFLILLGFFFFLFALYEERDEAETDEEQEKSDHLVIIFMVLCVIFLFLGGICMMYVSQTYYSPVTDTLEEILIPEYRPLGWIGIFVSFIAGLILTNKVFDLLGEGLSE